MADTLFVPFALGYCKVYWGLTDGKVAPNDDSAWNPLGFTHEGLDISVITNYDDWWTHRYGPGSPIDWVISGHVIQVRAKIFAERDSIKSFISSVLDRPYNVFAQSASKAHRFLIRAKPIRPVNPPVEEWRIRFLKCKVDELEWNFGIKYTLLSLGFVSHMALVQNPENYNVNL